MEIKGFVPMGGHHCITTSLKQVLQCKGLPISEPMLLGLGSGLGFIYLNQRQAPMISFRTKPEVFETHLADRLGITLKVKKPSSPEAAFKQLHKELENGNPVMVYVDMPYLPYLNMEDSGHFGGHSVVVTGYDESDNCYLVSDRDNSDWSIHTSKGPVGSDIHRVPVKTFHSAWDSTHRPFPARNKWVSIQVGEVPSITKETLKTAIQINADNQLNAPARLLGLNGMEKFADETRKWRKFDTDKRKLTGINNYFMISAKGGTGGGAFRRMYGDFLKEASQIEGCGKLAAFAPVFAEMAGLWDSLADDLWQLYETTSDDVIMGMPEKILQAAELEKETWQKLTLWS